MRIITTLALLALSMPASGQNATHESRGRWSTVTTEHYRLHYPKQAEAWAMEIAGQLDSIRERVAEEVGYMPTRTVDIVVMDPYRDSNGFALPFVRKARMGVFATPPGASSALGNYRTWAEDLVVHEDAHLVHLMRPTRAPGRKLVQAFLNVGPVSADSPAWVVEGYATVVEGRLTGRGRPNSDYRATLLRSLAQEGRMPTYSGLNGSGRWGSRGYRYFIGSAFLEWLERGAYDGALRDLWSRMSARANRPFTSSFEGIFGDDPEAMYGQFVAELSRDAMAIDQARPLHEGIIFADLSESTGAPAVNADGTQLAAVVSNSRGRGQLVVWSTAANEDAAEAFDEKVEELGEEDPEDVPARRPDVFEAEELHRRVNPTRTPRAPRWTPDGQVLFASWGPDVHGWARPDLYLWDPEGGERRVTRGASIVSADPHPDGLRAYGIRTVWGEQQLVEIDLEDGSWTSLSEASTVVLDAPRVSPDGERVAWLRNSGDGWKLVVRELTSGTESVYTPPGDSIAADPQWLPDSRGLVVSHAIGGFIELATWYPGDSEPESFTATRGGAYAPAVSASEVFFLTMDAEGRDLRRVALPGAAVTTEEEPPQQEKVDDERSEGQAPDSETTDTAVADEVEASSDESEIVDTEGGEVGSTAEGAPDDSQTTVEEPSEAAEAKGSDEEEASIVEPVPMDESMQVGPADYAAIGPLAMRPEPPAPIDVPAVQEVSARAYGLGRMEVRPLAAFVAGPSNLAAQGIIRVGDVAGRVDAMLVGGTRLASVGGTDGGAALLGYRGPFTVSVHAFRTREDAKNGWLQQRQGLEVALSEDWVWSGGTVGGRMGVFADQGWGEDVEAGARQVAFVEGDLREDLWLGSIALTADAAGLTSVGTTDGLFHRRHRFDAAAGLGGRSWRLVWREGRGQLVGVGVGDLDAFRLGGQRSTLLPEAMHLGHALVPAFAPGDALGETLATTAAELEIAGNVAAWRRTRVGDSEVQVVEVASRLKLRPTPLVGLPSVDIESGTSCTIVDLDGPVQKPCLKLSDYALWLSLVWRP